LKNLLLAGAGLAALISAAAARAQSAHMLADDAAAFGARQAVSEADLSPDGSTVLYLTPGPGWKTFAVVGSLDTGQFKQMVSTDGDPESLSWCHFASMTRAVCKFGGLVESQALGDLLGFSRLIAMDTNGTNAKLLGQPESAHESGLRQNDGEIIDWLAGSEGEVLVDRLYLPEEVLGTNIKRRKKGWGVDRLNVTTLRSDPIEEPRDAAGYMTDGLGQVRVMSITDARDSGMLTGRVRYFYRTQKAHDWKPLFTVTDTENPEIEPLAVDASIDTLYALKKKNGRYALYAIKLDGSMAETQVAENPRVDIGDVVRFGEGQKVIGYSYAEEKGEVVYFDPEFKALADSLSRVLPKSPIVEFVDASRDGRKLLIFAGSDSDPGRYFLFDRDRKTLTPAMIARPELEGRTLASVKPVTIAAPDGASIPAYLTLPPGKDPKGLPAVVLPHGGPSDRDVWGFDWLPQFLAARGFAVLQPNYRGSAGYGDA
jgi:dipeptidyl aminopeptidase/acylaminoacyl peptidase